MDEKTVLEKYTEQGCGECPKNKILCKECKEGLCNSEDFIKNINLCWDNNADFEFCGDKNCYYAVGWDNKDFRGCANTRPANLKDIPFVVCNKKLCNTKELFDNTLFCLNKRKEDLKYTKGIDKCDQECFVHRHLDGKLEQGCGKCPSNTDKFCKTCKTKYCNEEKLVPEVCMGNDGKTCTINYGAKCFTERTQNNKLSKGCGYCDSTACKDCNGNLCNAGDNIPYYCLDNDGRSLKECNKPECFISKGTTND